jgi:hypothetical protein
VFSFAKANTFNVLQQSAAFPQVALWLCAAGVSINGLAGAGCGGSMFPSSFQIDQQAVAFFLFQALIVTLLGHLVFTLQKGEIKEALAKAVGGVLIFLLILLAVRVGPQICPACFEKPPKKTAPTPRPKATKPTNFHAGKKLPHRNRAKTRTVPKCVLPCTTERHLQKLKQRITNRCQETIPACGQSQGRRFSVSDGRERWKKGKL